MDLIAQAISKAGIDVPIYAHEVEGTKVKLHLPWSTVEVDLTEQQVEPEPDPPREITPQPTLALTPTRSSAKKIAR